MTFSKNQNGKSNTYSTKLFLELLGSISIIGSLFLFTSQGNNIMSQEQAAQCLLQQEVRVKFGIYHKKRLIACNLLLLKRFTV
jgi:hypothetical protein